MSIDRKELTKILKGLSPEDKETILEELGAGHKSDDDIISSIASLNARLDALEKIGTVKPPDDSGKKKKDKGVLDSLNELIIGKGD